MYSKKATIKRQQSKTNNTATTKRKTKNKRKTIHTHNIEKVNWS